MVRKRGHVRVMFVMRAVELGLVTVDHLLLKWAELRMERSADRRTEVRLTTSVFTITSVDVWFLCILLLWTKHFAFKRKE